MRFKVMPFGMVNSGSTYNRMIRKLLDGSHNLESYVDDVLGHTGNWSKHMEILRDFFERVRKANLCLRPSKCKIGFDQVKFLGHTLQGNCIKPQDEPVGRILDTERPKTKKSCRSLLGMINFYRRYCAEVIAPLTELTKNRAPNNVQWGEEQERAFKEVKKILSSEPILKMPEALAIVWAVNKFHRYLYGQHFILESDHRPLEYLQTSHSKRWSLSLQVRYIRGTDNVVADYLSRSSE